MDEKIKKFIYDAINIEEILTYEFRTICGFTFVFKKEELLINKNFSSAEILPVGIIYDENGEYYLAPLHDTIEINDIIKEFVEKVI